MNQIALRNVFHYFTSVDRNISYSCRIWFHLYIVCVRVRLAAGARVRFRVIWPYLYISFPCTLLDIPIKISYWVNDKDVWKCNFLYIQIVKWRLRYGRDSMFQGKTIFKKQVTQVDLDLVWGWGWFFSMALSMHFSTLNFFQFLEYMTWNKGGKPARSSSWNGTFIGLGVPFSGQWGVQ